MNVEKYSPVASVEIYGNMSPTYAEILTPDALRFVAQLQREFGPVRAYLLEKRKERQAGIDAGKMPDFLPETAAIRNDHAWKIAPVPHDLDSRCVEITGPVDRKMVINALNSGADVYMADFEDSHAPTWSGTVEGQINLRDAVRRTITYETPKKKYLLNEETATLMVRPRGWHLVEKHVLVDGAPVSASLFDFGLFLYHNAHALIERETGPYFYVPKIESHKEAKLWNEVIVFSQDYLKIPQKTVKTTVLIETILAAFEMDEILYELKDHSAGLNCGRWDYIFSCVKKFRNNPEYVLPDRSQITMDAACMKAYRDLLIKTCHVRGAHAMGGMAAQIPIKNNVEANESALEKVHADKRRDVFAGHDGTWVAHPDLVSLARHAFKNHMHGPNQLWIQLDDVVVQAKDLLQVPEGTITEQGLRTNIKIGIQYVEAWLRGNGCVPLYNLMEDAATAEISRSQVWQWLKHEAQTECGQKITHDLYAKVEEEEMCAIEKEVGKERFAQGKYERARTLFRSLVTSQEFVEFLTLPAYEELE